MGCHALLPGIFPTQGSNLRLLHCRQILYRLSQQRRAQVGIRECSSAGVGRKPFSGATMLIVNTASCLGDRHQPYRWRWASVLPSDTSLYCLGSCREQRNTHTRTHTLTIPFRALVHVKTITHRYTHTHTHTLMIPFCAFVIVKTTHTQTHRQFPLGPWFMLRPHTQIHTHTHTDNSLLSFS